METHGVNCNCEDCWWAHDCREVDEEGIPISEEEDGIEVDFNRKPTFIQTKR